jgi:hypothetical protein
VNLWNVRGFLPGGLRQAAGVAGWGVSYAFRQLNAALLRSRWPENVKRLRAFHDLHFGQRCFILGNGPSLRQTDLSLLREEFTFGLNRVYLLFPELGFTTTYLVAINALVIRQCAHEIASLDIPHFVTWNLRRHFENDPRALFVDTRFTGANGFSSDPTRRLFEGYTVTYVAMQLAHFMGFSQVILVGVDHSFKTEGKPNRIVVSEGKDPNHFSTVYFGKGFRWQLPDLDNSERAYLLARQVYEKSGRSIVDATVGGKLNVFPKVDYLSLF